MIRDVGFCFSLRQYELHQVQRVFSHSGSAETPKASLNIQTIYDLQSCGKILLSIQWHTIQIVCKDIRHIVKERSHRFKVFDHFFYQIVTQARPDCIIRSRLYS